MQSLEDAENPTTDETMNVDEHSTRSTKKVRTVKRTFADTVSSQPPLNANVDSRVETHEWAFEDPEIESDAEMDMADKSDGRLRVVFSKELRKELCSEWKLALIIKYLGKNVSFSILNQRLPVMWNLQGHLHLIDIGFGCFVARFDNKTDYLHVLLDGPWKIFDNYLLTQRWVPNFKARTSKFEKMAVWVRLPELSVEYFRNDTIKSILENVGKPLKLDRTTIAREKGRYARAAVEVDLNKLLISEVLVGNEVQIIEYEGLHVVCFGCGVVGHREQQCPHNKHKEPETATMDMNTPPANDTEKEPQSEPVPPMVTPTQAKQRYGTWMLVTRKKTQTDASKGHRHSKKTDRPPVNRGNKFQPLAAEVEGDGHTAAPVRRTSQMTQENAKGKSANSPNQFRKLTFSRTEKDRRAGAGNPNYPNTNVRGRGNSLMSSRGRETATNNRGPAPQMTPHTTSSGVGNTGNSGNVGYFQFGSQPLASNMQTAGAHHTGNVGSTSRFTPGEGGGQTSLPANPSP
ncbi:uncharacterized protein LOC116019614 [Ipomoea triloba]|uniref:uncharacterized protein LOC116019613 n=1 Tax=Ipomoea triloba TaxID=35885 RepID=UPI00125E1ACE|nr:uncharacterized protein LOC116019613 [Ipomoea triloba]XP_031115747.1 uncharacterized protein LOC116019614 [Ipomoea triloba]